MGMGFKTNKATHLTLWCSAKYVFIFLKEMQKMCYINMRTNVNICANPSCVYFFHIFLKTLITLITEEEKTISCYYY